MVPEEKRGHRLALEHQRSHDGGGLTVGDYLDDLGAGFGNPSATCNAKVESCHN